jgi:hypothetical protein
MSNNDFLNGILVDIFQSNPDLKLVVSEKVKNAINNVAIDEKEINSYIDEKVKETISDIFDDNNILRDILEDKLNVMIRERLTLNVNNN